jgi:Helicase HerA, central domain
VDGWQGFQFYRLVAAPRPPRDSRHPDPTPSQLFAALTASYAALTGDGVGDDSALAVGWLRPEGVPQITFVAGGRPWFPPAGDTGPLDDTGPDDEIRILYPPGARGRPLPVGELEQMAESLPHWVACAGQSDTLWLADASGREGTLRGSFDDYVAHLHGAFGWIVLAEPLPPDAVDEELAQLAVRIPTLRKRENSEQHRLELERAEGRYRELSKSRVTGLWSVRVLVGGQTGGTARSAAALLCSASELDDVPYVLLPGRGTTTFADALSKPVQLGDGSRAPFTASSELVLALARPPSRELPGIRLVAPPCFDVTPEPASGDSIPLGAVLDEARRPAGEFRVPRSTLNRHAFICGATGSGKSQTMRTLLESLGRAAEPPVPWLVIEPAKAEYARMAGRLDGVAEVTVIRPGDPDVAPASLNPLEPEPGFPLQSHADLVRALFLAAFEANEPFPQVLSRALTQVYTDAGWDLVTGLPRPAGKPKLVAEEADVPRKGRYPTLGQLQQTASTIVEQIGYGKEITADVRGFVDVRMGSLREGTPGRFFEGGHPLDVEDLLRRNVVLELEDITNDQDKAFLIGAVLIRIVEHLRVRAARGAVGRGLQHVTVVEEAHRLLKNVHDGPAAAAVELFASLLAEIRAYGEGVIVVEQIPAKILPDVIKNSALKVVHRLPALDDREAVGGTINLQPDQSELVVSFEPGVAAVAVDGMDRPVMVRIPGREDTESDAGVVRHPPLRTARSPLCAADCPAAPCSLTAINDHEHRARDPLLTVWVEAAVISFLIGEPPPLPSPGVRTALSALDPRPRRCVLVHAVERSVAARHSQLMRWFDPDDFAAHLLRTLEQLLVGDRTEEGDWRRWTAGFFRWVQIRDALRRAVDSGRGAEPNHPDSPAWASMGMPLEGPTRSAQLAQLLAHPTYGEGRQQFLLGDVSRTRLLAAIQELAGTASDTGLGRCLDQTCRGQRNDLIVPRIGGLLRKAAAEGAR